MLFGRDRATGRLALLAIACAVALGGLAAQAGAAVYWAEGFAIGRVNLDGTNPSPGLIPRTDNLGPTCGLAVDDTHIYWARRFEDAIARADLEGNNREPEFITGVDEPCGVAIRDGFLYWTNYGGNSIGRARVDGTEVIREFVPAVNRPCGVAVSDDFIYWSSTGIPAYIGRALRVSGAKGPHLVDFDPDLGYDPCGVAVSDDHVYWGGFGDAIGRVGVDGENLEMRFITGVYRPCSVAIHGDRLYWGDVTTPGGLGGHVGRSNLDGSGFEREFVTGLGEPCGIAVDSRVFGPAYIAPPPLPPWTPCKIDRATVNKWNGSALVRVNGPTQGRLRLLTKGLRARVISKQPPKRALNHASWRWWIRIWPGAKGRAGRNLRTWLASKGRAPLKLRIACSEEGSVDNQSVRRLVLHKRAVHRKRLGHSRRRAATG